MQRPDPRDIKVKLCFRLIKSHIQKGLWYESSKNLSIEIEIVFRINLKHSPNHKSS